MCSTYPAYNDFGKSTKDFFTKGFQTGNFKLNIKDNASKHIKAKINGSHNIEKNEASGEFQAELTCPVLPGYTSTTKWTTGNIVHQELTVNNRIKPGLLVGLEGDYNIDSSSISGKLTSVYKHPKVTLDGLAQGGDSDSPVVGASFVTGYKDFAAGFQGELDVSGQAVKKYNAAVAYVKGPFSFHTNLDNAELVWSGLVYRYNPSLEFGVTGTYKSDPEGYYAFGAVAKYVMDCCTAVKAKFDSDMQIGLGFETKIRQNATVTMSANIDGNKLDAGGHTVGLTFDLES